MLSQLVYVSNRKQNCSAEEIEKILNSCKKNNPPLDIEGVLLYSNTKFIQLVEGLSWVYMKKSRKTPGTQTPLWLHIVPSTINRSQHMAKRFSSSDLQFKKDISGEDKRNFNAILNGKEEAGQRVLNLLK